MTKNMPIHKLRVFRTADVLSPEVEAFFSAELAEFRELASTRKLRYEWGFAIVCAVDAQEQVLGGAYFEYGPRKQLNNTPPPLADENVAILEHILVLPELRKQGLGGEILNKALNVAQRLSCQHMRCNAQWDDPAEIGLYKKCGFALTDIEDGSFFAVKPLC